MNSSETMCCSRITPSIEIVWFEPTPTPLLTVANKDLGFDPTSLPPNPAWNFQ